MMNFTAHGKNKAPKYHDNFTRICYGIFEKGNYSDVQFSLGFQFLYPLPTSCPSRAQYRRRRRKKKNLFVKFYKK